ncbi:hypothetical protein V8E53_013078 [Lactarius tabidus]
MSQHVSPRSSLLYCNAAVRTHTIARTVPPSASTCSSGSPSGLSPHRSSAPHASWHEPATMRSRCPLRVIPEYISSGTSKSALTSINELMYSLPAAQPTRATTQTAPHDLRPRGLSQRQLAYPLPPLHRMPRHKPLHRSRRVPFVLLLYVLHPYGARSQLAQARRGPGRRDQRCLHGGAVRTRIQYLRAVFVGGAPEPIPAHPPTHLDHATVLAELVAAPPPPPQEGTALSSFAGASFSCHSCSRTYCLT